MSQGIIPPHGGYRKLLSYQKAQIVYDATVFFCERFIDRYSRTRDQMIQAARSGKQNIVEGSMSAATSKVTELKLTSVARASLEELLEDYRDFLRTQDAPEWPLDHPHTRRMRELNRIPGATYETFRNIVEHSGPTVSANAIIGLIRVTNCLLDRQLRSLEQVLITEGGLRERVTRARRACRRQLP